MELVYFLEGLKRKLGCPGHPVDTTLAPQWPTHTTSFLFAIPPKTKVDDYRMV